ncbi:MAG: 3-hydroxyacyl-[acyl-carrier-protein] dehydratase FabZ [Bdellovibrionales bacterium RBG_16_40_8]|nr:MAG: 3-hydroxyacyl-[acyl-carrier-protein] dehydratase FabZ [Bdellovibrionales bacterium RBG_16_40_8]
MQIDKILEILPHRQPFVLIDRVLEIIDPGDKTRLGRKVKVLKNISYNEPFFAGHFPHRPVMPGVLILESMAQAAAIACWRETDPKMDVAIGRVSEFRIRRPVVPGDQLIIRGEVVKDRGQIVVIKTASFVDNELVTEVEILASMTPIRS